MRRYRWLGGLALVMLLLLRSRDAMLGASQALSHWYASVAPALLPFLALLPLLTCPEAVQAYEKLLGRVAKALFDLPGPATSAMIIGMVAGMPAGVVAARDIAARSGMNRGQLHRVAVASSGFSPAFLVGGVGAGMLGSAALGWKLWQAQLLTQVTLAFLLRGAWKERVHPVTGGDGDRGERPPFSAILTVGGYMALFGALTGAIGGIVGARPAQALLCLLDVPTGARHVADLPMVIGTKMVLLSAMCGFGGACVALQGMGVLKDCGFGWASYIGMRGAAAAISAGYMALLVRLPMICSGTTIHGMGENALAQAALIASIMAVPVLIRLNKTIS